MLLMRVGHKIGIPLHLANRRMLDGQNTVRKVGVDPCPSLAVDTGTDPISIPCLGVARLTGIQDPQGTRLISHAIDPKMKPLHVFIPNILFDVEIGSISRSDFHNLDVSRIKIRIDVHSLTSEANPIFAQLK